ncbi:ParB/RepB/Spo0J family partition protein [Consotaella aegiceratis]|uniref:ParB/RepB/Spo0J family partition protein n=1 Tax=Consotaella aegiceratis TaxID=3097961 RepID=UPI002F3F404F
MTERHGIKAIALGRSDVFRLDPRHLHVKEGWNSREVDFDPTDPEDLSLAHSIAEVGVKEPLTIVWEDGKAFVTNGHRRRGATLHAIDVLGAEIKSVPAQTEDRYSSEADRVLSQIVRNSGKPLTPFEQSKVFKRLIDFGWSEKEIAAKVGRSEGWVRQLLELQAAPEEVKSLVRTNQVSATLAAKVTREAGPAAAERLAKAVETAKAAGKKRATAKHVEPQAKAEPAQEPVGYLYDVLCHDGSWMTDFEYGNCPIPPLGGDIRNVRGVYALPPDTAAKIARARADERQRIARQIEEEADVTPCQEDANVTRGLATLVRAGFSYDDAERLETDAEAQAAEIATLRAENERMRAALDPFNLIADRLFVTGAKSSDEIEISGEELFQALMAVRAALGKGGE